MKVHILNKITRNVLIYTVVLCSLLGVFGGVAYAQQGASEYERIEHFNSNITVNADSSLKVTEDIQVYATGDQIRHGIYRDFPTSYKDRFGNKIRVGFTIVSVERDNASEPYHTERKVNGTRIYFGDANTIIPTGLHTYTFTYTVTRELGFFVDHDELYWNVTGNGWIFPILNASAQVILPSGILSNKISTAAYTGVAGSKAQNFTVSTSEAGANFKTTKPLSAEEGLTIVVGFPKGFVQEPTTKQKIEWFLNDNKGILVSGILLLLLIAYYIRTWRKYGVDPAKGTIVAQYEAPRKLSPAGVFYIHKMGYRMNAFTAGVLSLAVKGYVHITNDDTRYVISKATTAGKGASTDEQALYDELFTESENITLSNAEYKRLQKAQAKQRAVLVGELGNNTYFINNTKYFVGGFLLSVVVIITAIALQAPPYAIALVIIACLVMDVLFYNLLRKRTLEGQELYEEIEGFKLYMSVAEKDRLNFHNPPEQTPQLFEKLLPYALALGVEQKWAEQFASVFAKLGPEGQGGYMPLWYTGAYFNAHSVGDFSSSFSSAISSSSTPPGSSSGGGGGGSSGGGGGGGGGGGW